MKMQTAALGVLHKFGVRYLVIFSCYNLLTYALFCVIMQTERGKRKPLKMKGDTNMKNLFSQFLDSVMEKANLNVNDFYALGSRFDDDDRIIGVYGVINPNISVRYEYDDPRIVFSVECVIYRGFDYSPKSGEVEAAGSMAKLIVRETDKGSALFKFETVEVIFEPYSTAAEAMQMYERFCHSWTEVAKEWKTSHSSELGVFGC